MQVYAFPIVCLSEMTFKWSFVLFYEHNEYGCICYNQVTMKSHVTSD